MGKQHSIVEQWRDGELIRQFKLTEKVLKLEDGILCIVLPPGYTEFGTGDELRIDPEHLIQQLQAMMK